MGVSLVQRGEGVWSRGGGGWGGVVVVYGGIGVWRGVRVCCPPGGTEDPCTISKRSSPCLPIGVVWVLGRCGGEVAPNCPSHFSGWYTAIPNTSIDGIALYPSNRSSVWQPAVKCVSLVKHTHTPAVYFGQMATQAPSRCHIYHRQCTLSCAKCHTASPLPPLAPQ